MTLSLIVRLVRKSFRFASAVMLIGLAAGPAFADPGVSGTYVSAGPNSAALIVIVQTPDGRISGRMESSFFDDSGVVETSSMTLEGAAEGSNVLLTPKSILLSLGSPPSYSGVFDGDRLDLSWQGGNRSFHRATAEQFRAAVSVLETRSGQIVADMALRKAISESADLTAMLDAIEHRTPSLRVQLSSASERYRSLFARMHNRRRAQTALANFPGQWVSSMEAGTDAQSVGLDINAVNLEVAGLGTEFRRQFDAARSGMAPIETYCTDAGDTSSLSPCAELAGQRVRLDSLRAVVQAEFDATQAAYHEASVDVPPGRRLIESIVRR